MKKTISIEGMMCGHCQMHVQNALESLDGVSKVSVNLENKQAIVELAKNVDSTVLTKAVVDAGYKVKKIN